MIKAEAISNGKMHGVAIKLKVKLRFQNIGSANHFSRSVLGLTWFCGVNDLVAFKFSFWFLPRHIQLFGAQDFCTKSSW